MGDGAAAVPDLGGLQVFAGRWAGQGAGHYPTICDFAYREEIDLLVGPKPFLTYLSRTWKAATGAPMHTETGYLRPAAGGTVELILAQPTGITEIHTGHLRGGVLDLAPAHLGLSPTAKDVRAVRRTLTVVGDVLTYDIAMAHAGTPLTHHLHAELRRT